MAFEAGYSSDGVALSMAPAPALPKATRRTKAGAAFSQAALHWFVAALVLRLVAALAIHLYSLSRGFGGLYPLASGHDDVVYWDLAQKLYRGQEVPYTSSVYPYVLGAFFRFTGGPDLLIGKLLNVLAGSVTVGVGVLLVGELTRGQLSKKQRRRAVAWAGALLTFYPSLLWYSTQLVKDPILVMLGIIALYLQVRLLRRPRLALAVTWMAVSAALYFFRPYAALGLALSLFLFTVRFNLRWLIPSLLLTGIVPYELGLGWFGISYVLPLLDVEHLSSFREEQYSVGGSVAGISIDYSTPLAFVATYSNSFATAMFGPFPWQITASGQAIALPEAVGMWLLFPLWVKGVWDLLGGRTSRDRNRHLPALLLLFSLVSIGAVAIFSDNIGANTRLRLLPWSAFLLYSALRLARKRLVM